ncbi:22671_t:CDS:2, partial [Racocetra persica]
EEKAKYKFCKTVACYTLENNISEQELAKRLEVSHSKVEKVIFCHIDELDLKELVDYVAKLSLPWEKPANLRPYDYRIRINWQRFTKLEISPYYEKHNKEYLEALEKKGIVLSKAELAEKLITDVLIMNVLLPQLDGERGIISEGRYYNWTYYSRRTFKETETKIKAYKLVWCVADDEPHILGLMDCYRQIITGNKGGTGKTTIAALLAEYLIYQKKKVNLIDADPNQAFQSWINNCQEEGRPVSSRLPVDYQIIDTAGVSGGSETYLKRADIMIVPFIPHYVDLQEQQEGLNQLKDETGRDKKAGIILPPLSSRPALYGSVLNGSKDNFFTKPESEQVKKIFQELFNHYEKNKKSS